MPPTVGFAHASGLEAARVCATDAMASSRRLTDRMEHETVAVDTFIGRMVQYVLPKGFKRIRYAGV
jgi:hypothetical protein